MKIKTQKICIGICLCFIVLTALAADTPGMLKVYFGTGAAISLGIAYLIERIWG